MRVAKKKQYFWKRVKELRVKIDNNLNFNTYAKGLCKSAYTLKLKELLQERRHKKKEKKEASHEFFF